MWTNILLRKVLAAFFITLLISLILSFSTLKMYESPYHQGNQLLGWSIVYLVYMGAVVFTLGIIFSVVIELLQQRLKFHSVIFVMLHGLAGTIGGLIYQAWGFAFLGIIVGLLCASIDRLILYLNKKSVYRYFIVVPIVLYVCVWGVLELQSPNLPPFTKEDAVEMATEPDGTIIEMFPKEVGVWNGKIDGYSVLRETRAEETSNEVFHITFTEKWEQNDESGEWSIRYEVDRSSMTAKKSTGERPPYWH